MLLEEMPSHFTLSCGISVDAERRKLYLQLTKSIVDAAHQGELCRDLRKQELRIIAKIKGKCKLYLRNILQFAAKPSRECTAKNTRKALHFADFRQY